MNVDDLISSVLAVIVLELALIGLQKYWSWFTKDRDQWDHDSY